MFFEGLETCLVSYGYKVTHGDQRDPGLFVSWAEAKKPVPITVSTGWRD